MRLPMLAALAATVVLAAPASADHRGKVPWVDDPAAGLAQARREGKPALLFFSAEW